MQTLGKYFVLGGLILIVIGVLLWVGGNRFHFLGNLPGDIKIRNENFSFYFPLTTCLLLSAIATLLWWLVRKLFS